MAAFVPGLALARSVDRDVLAGILGAMPHKEMVRQPRPEYDTSALLAPSQEQCPAAQYASVSLIGSVRPAVWHYPCTLQPH